jgi:hypothetical protein
MQIFILKDLMVGQRGCAANTHPYAIEIVETFGTLANLRQQIHTL